MEDINTQRVKAARIAPKAKFQEAMSQLKIFVCMFSWRAEVPSACRRDANASIRVPDFCNAQHMKANGQTTASTTVQKS